MAIPDEVAEMEAVRLRYNPWLKDSEWLSAHPQGIPFPPT